MSSNIHSHPGRLIDDAISLKIHAKLQGTTHVVQPERCGADKDTMIVGADVTHPPKGVEQCPSMAAVVATNDDNSYQYLGSARLQPARKEVRF